MTNKKPILRIGSGFETPEFKKDVQELQTLLKAGSFLPENALIDGLFGKITERAVIAFQNSKNLTTDGVVGEQTWTFLESYSNLISTVKNEPKFANLIDYSASNKSSKHHILKLGDGINTPELQDEVKYLQTLLKEQKFLEKNSLTDGLFWQKTDLAVKEFQKSHNLLQNGIVNEQTWQSLESQVIQSMIEEKIETNQISPNQNFSISSSINGTETMNINQNINQFESQYPSLEIGDGLNTPHLQGEVKYLQELLQKQGFLAQNFSLDGFFWTETETAIKELQKSRNLGETGIVNREIWQVLENRIIPDNLTNIETIEVQNEPILIKEKITELEIVNLPDSNSNYNSNEEIKNIDLNLINSYKNISYPNLKKGDGLNTPELQEEVKKLQTLLQNQGFFPENSFIDGLFWQETEEGVKAFQKSKNLPDNGIVNPETWRALENKEDQELISEINPENEQNQFGFQQGLLKEENVSQNPVILTNQTIEINEINEINRKNHLTLKLGSGIDTPELQDEVKYLQTLLQEWGILGIDLEVNGLFWRETEGAVKIFQQRNNLTVDGIVNQDTWMALEGLQTSNNLSNNLSTFSQNLEVLESEENVTPKTKLESVPSEKIFTPQIKEEEINPNLENLSQENPPKMIGFNVSSTKKHSTLKLGDGIYNITLKEEVKYLQTLLKQYKFLPQDALIDGLFWHKTETAVKALQKSQNLLVDGIVAKITWNALEKLGEKTGKTLAKNPVNTPSISAKKYPVLKLRDGIDTPNLKEDVKKLQTLLKKWNSLHQNTVIDGLFWKATEEGVKAFQKSKNLVVDGIVGQKTWELLEKNPPSIPQIQPPISPPPVINNSVNKYPILKFKDGIDTPNLKEAVKQLQILLQKHQFLPKNTIIDGLFWKSTDSAVKEFQKSKNLVADGIVGQKTWQFLQQNPPVLTPPTTPIKSPVVTTPVINKYPVLKLGDGIKTPELKDVVKKLQTMLKTYHFLPENTLIDGLFGAETEKAVKTFQQTQNLTPDGVIGEKTWQFLESLIDGKAIVKPVLKLQDGIDFPELINEVKSLQTLLKQYNLIKIIDGLFGKATETAVKTFQKNNKLNPDGIVGKQTWSLLAQKPINTYFPFRQFSNLNLVNNLIKVITNATIKRYASQSIPLILQETQKYNIVDKGQIAYILATAQHESRLGQWMVEFATGQAYEGRRDLGNINAGDGPRYKGRGFVQITGRRNYTDWSKRLGIDLVNYPDKATDYAISAKILVLGMRDGTFTSRRLSQYVNGSMRDFYNARRVINGLDQATHIAGLAENFFRVL